MRFGVKANTRAKIGDKSPRKMAMCHQSVTELSSVSGYVIARTLSRRSVSTTEYTRKSVALSRQFSLRQALAGNQAKCPRLAVAKKQ
jgi:hypothetical protein